MGLNFFLVGISKFQNFFLRVICGSEIFCVWVFRGFELFPCVSHNSQNFPCGYFVVRKFFLVDISWFEISFLKVFSVSKIFSCGYFMGLNCFLVGISKFPNFFLWVFHGFEIVSCVYLVGLWVFHSCKIFS